LTRTQGDQLVLDSLQTLDADLSQPREVIHFLYVPTEEAARQVAEELKSRGYSVEQKPAPIVEKEPINPFCLIASNRFVSYSTTVQKFRHFFEQLAEFHQGDYDGWEAASKP
jgi:regulator of ribonuclease activity B